MKALLIPLIIGFVYLLEAIGHKFGICFHGLASSIAGLIGMGGVGVLYYRNGKETDKK